MPITETQPMRGLPDPAAIAARASTLGERLAHPVGLEADPTSSPRRLERWSRVVARSDDERFEHRLRLDRIDPDTAAALVGAAAPLAPVPPWAEVLQEALSPQHLDAEPPQPGSPLPLSELVEPFVRAAASRLNRTLAGPGDVSEAALHTLERRLARELSGLFTSVGDLEFRLWRRPYLDPLAEALSRAGEPGRDLYDRWIGELRGGGLAALLDEYPVLARRAATFALGWSDATAEFFSHLRADRELLAREFCEGAALGALVEIDGSSSDPHRGRRRVLGCTFESGVKIVYKPKSLRTEIFYNDLLRWLNGRGAEPPLRALRVADCGDHGWVEFAEQSEAEDDEAARRFYRRGGLLLALLYALGGNDCHMENVVAAGEHPFIIDAETVLHPTFVRTDGADAGLSAPPDAADTAIASVLSVGLLPTWMAGADGASLDVSGFGAIDAQQSLDATLRWDHPNTNAARLVLERSWLESQANVLRVDRQVQRPENFPREIVTGFLQGYRILLEGRDELLAPDGPLAELAEAPVRVIVRPTHTYFRVLDLATQPQHMHAGIDYSIELELLARPLLDTEPEAAWELHRLEQEQLEAGDVPFFVAPGGADAIAAADGTAVLRFAASALDTARGHLMRLGADDEQRQLAFLRAALGTRTPHVSRPQELPAGGTVAEDVCLRAAIAIGEELEATAIRSGGRIGWIGLSLSDEAERWMLRPTGGDLYEGGPGIAVFFGALWSATADARWRELAMAAMSPTVEEAERRPGPLAVVRGLGGAAGFGGLVYGLSILAELTGDDRTLAAATTLSRALPVAAIEADRGLDVLSGAAGALAGLLALDRVAGGDAAVIELAVVAGEVLRGAAETNGRGVRWRNPNGRSLDGFAHGNAGIALALARLATRTGDDGLARIAADAVRGGSARYDESAGGWPDRRYDDEIRLMHGWCHGTAGIGETRLGLLHTVVAAELKDVLELDLVRARVAVENAHTGFAHLCCGGAGETEFLLDLARIRGDAGARRLAEERCDAVAAAILEGERPLLSTPASGARDVPVPGLFQGTSGVGLALLRRAYPELPSVLLWR